MEEEEVENKKIMGDNKAAYVCWAEMFGLEIIMIVPYYMILRRMQWLEFKYHWVCWIKMIRIKMNTLRNSNKTENECKLYLYCNFYLNPFVCFACFI